MCWITPIVGLYLQHLVSFQQTSTYFLSRCLSPGIADIWPHWPPQLWLRLFSLIKRFACVMYIYSLLYLSTPQSAISRRVPIIKHVLLLPVKSQFFIAIVVCWTSALRDKFGCSGRYINKAELKWSFHLIALGGYYGKSWAHSHCPLVAGCGRGQKALLLFSFFFYFRLWSVSWCLIEVFWNGIKRRLLLVPVLIDRAQSQLVINVFHGFALASATVNTSRGIPPGRCPAGKAFFLQSSIHITNWRYAEIRCNFLRMTCAHL